MSRPFYDYPALYDAVHLADTPEEAEGLLKVIRRHAPRARRLLEPACGTGRFLERFARAGLQVHGYDTNRRALAFARRRLRGLPARAAYGDMASYAPPAAQAAFSLIGTFRHLSSDAAARAHLRLVARALPAGGVYVIGLDLVDYADCPPDEEGWEIVHRGRALRHLYQTLPPDGRKRRERVINFITVSTRRGERVLQDDYDLRSYDLRQWKALIARSPFTLAAAYDAAGKPMKLDRKTRYALFALVRK